MRLNYLVLFVFVLFISTGLKAQTFNGNDCANSIVICGNYTVTNLAANSSGQASSCFGTAPQRDIWLKFTIAQGGTLEWKATPTIPTTEFDWVLWDISGGCPGTNVCCNYNYAGGSTVGFGMVAQTGTVVCGTSALTTNPQNEFSPPTNVITGKAYALQISNYDNTSAGFSLSFVNSTCVLDCLTGITDHSNSSPVSVFPNPANDQIHIKSKHEIQKTELYNLAGELLLSEQSSDYTHTLNLESYSNGIYFLKVYRNGPATIHQKIIIQK